MCALLLIGFLIAGFYGIPISCRSVVESLPHQLSRAARHAGIAVTARAGVGCSARDA